MTVHRLNSRILALGFAGFLLTLRGWGLTRVWSALPEPAVRGLDFLLTVLFLAVLLDFARPPALPPTLERSSPRRLTALVCLLFAPGIFAVFYLQDRFYSRFGYDVAMPTVLAALLPWVLFFAPHTLRSREKESSTPLFFAAAAGFSAFLLLSMHAFPLARGRSDMLPLIVDALGHFLSGENPYALPDAGTPLTYLPGMWLTFLPGHLLGLDPRVTHLLACVVSLALLYRARVHPALLAVFASIPYLVFRHETYVGVHWLSLVLVYVLLRAGRSVTAAAAYGWGLAVSPFAWVTLPVFLAICARLEERGRGWITALLTAAAVAAMFILPFALWNPAAFLDSTVFYWSPRMAPASFNFSSLVIALGSPTILLALQIVVWLTLSVLAGRKLRGITDGFAWMGWVLLAFILLNRVIWTYFFPAILLLFMMATGDLSELNPRGVRSRPKRRRGQAPDRDSLGRRRSYPR